MGFVRPESVQGLPKVSAATHMAPFEGHRNGATLGSA